ncbi:Nucleotide-binding universal stress protein, UspA family [Saccharicrinis carchari]|uniref:Nucleotide-binding universal stress protein, UspA family n=1 Tax=Saccharicrinis carchari TaxID=1168039 RepID=A0A521EKJ6_SACCC|nr:universal stress protein [Saccharicrinis carchari]SMO84412.1 Nucleotide-binding universal stress protein, UspA family [Saccharicrinis carchari]
MKRILVPIDFSESAMNALKHGIAIANKLDSDLRIIHVNTKMSAQVYLQKNAGLLVSENAEEWLSDIVYNCKKDYRVPGGTIDYKVREGNVFKEISNQAKYDDTTLIVMGTHGASGFEDKYIGSNAYRLVSASPAPVLAIRPERVWRGINKIVLPISNRKASRQKVPAVVGLAKLFDAKIFVVGVKEKGYNLLNSRVNVYVRQTVKFIEKNTKLSVESKILKQGDRAMVLLNFASSIDADVLATGIHHSGNPFDNLIKPFANQIINQSDCPVLAIPTKEMLSLSTNY